MYQKIAAVTWVKTRQEYGVYHSSIQNLANYFGVHHQSLQRAVSNLVNKSGWLDSVEPRRTGNPSARRLRVDSNGHKDLRIVTHDEWVQRHPNANCCFVPDAMPWDGETKDKLAIALHRESKGNAGAHQPHSRLSDWQHEALGKQEHNEQRNTDSRAHRIHDFGL